MDDRFKLSDDDHRLIYEKIERRSLAGSTPVEKPRIVITGGQPGSGKSRLIELSKEEFPDGNVVVINGDELRYYHPQAQNILELDDKRFAERTDPDSRNWTRELFDKAIEDKRNIIFESTMRETGPLSKTMMRLKEGGYEISARVVACHERTSATGIFMRYETQKAEKGYGRFSEMTSHDAGYEGMPRTLDHIEQNKLVDKIEVYDRTGQKLYTNELKDGRWKNDPKAVEAVQSERSRQPTRGQVQEFQSDWKRINRLMEKRQATLREFEQARKVYDKFNRQLEPGRKNISSRSESRESGEPGEQSRDSAKFPEHPEQPEQPNSRKDARLDTAQKIDSPRDIQQSHSPGKPGKPRAISGKEFSQARDSRQKVEHQPERSSSQTKQIRGRDFADSVRCDSARNPIDRQVTVEKASPVERAAAQEAARQSSTGQDKGVGGRIAGGDRGYGIEPGGMDR